VGGGVRTHPPGYGLVERVSLGQKGIIANRTELAKHIWKLNDDKENYKINWSIISSASAYSNISKRCYLCVTEKLHIIKADKASNLNKRNELIFKCLQENKYFLMNTDLRLQ